MSSHQKRERDDESEGRSEQGEPHCQKPQNEEFHDQQAPGDRAKTPEIKPVTITHRRLENPNDERAKEDQRDQEPYHLRRWRIYSSA